MPKLFPRKAGRRTDKAEVQLDFWPVLRTRSMVALARLRAGMQPHPAAAAAMQEKRPGARPQLREDGHRGASRRVSPSSNTGMNK